MRFVRWLVSAVFVSAMVSAPVQAQGQDPETEAFVRGFVRFLAYHEAGHMLMGQIADLNFSFTTRARGLLNSEELLSQRAIKSRAFCTFCAGGCFVGFSS